MATFHDEVEIEDFVFDEEQEIFFYPCPCGDKFQISLVCYYIYEWNWWLQEQIYNGEDVATCPSCSLLVRVIYDPDDFVEEVEQADDTQVCATIVVA